ncbi:MAG: hypothetical protein RLY93_06170 [Sumerlaeia bacterium]
MNRLALSAIRQLLAFGEAPAKDLAGFDELLNLGVVRLSQDGERVVAAPRLVRTLRRMGKEEADAGLSAVHPDVYTAWLKVACARLEEKGLQKDEEGLIEIIDQLGPAAERAVELWPERGLKPSNMETLERLILESPAHEAVATPRVLRAVAAAGAILADPTAKRLAALPDVNDQDPSGNWVEGRVLLLPGNEPILSPTSVLTGSLEPLEGKESSGTMKWALARPWAFLLGQLVFMQEAWQAERISGQLELELPREEVGTFHQPAAVRVVVTKPDGAEVECGTLGELVRRSLDEMGVVLLTADVETATLDAVLAPVIAEMLTRQVWTFDSGRGTQTPGYRIHPDFSDECYRALGSRYFYRKATSITMAMRRACEAWAEERLVRAGAANQAEVAG